MGQEENVKVLENKQWFVGFLCYCEPSRFNWFSFSGVDGFFVVVTESLSLSGTPILMV